MSGPNMARPVSPNISDWNYFILLALEVNHLLWVTSHSLDPVLTYSQWFQLKKNREKLTRQTSALSKENQFKQPDQANLCTFQKKSLLKAPPPRKKIKKAGKSFPSQRICHCITLLEQPRLLQLETTDNEKILTFTFCLKTKRSISLNDSFLVLL